MRLIILSILLSAISMPLHASSHTAHYKDSITTKKLIADIAETNVYAPDALAKAGQLIQVKRGDLLKKESPYELLKICMENPNAVVRLYAFKALAEKMDNLPAEAVLKFRNDNTPVNIQSHKGEKQLPVWQIANGFLK